MLARIRPYRTSVLGLSCLLVLIAVLVTTLLPAGTTTAAAATNDEEGMRLAQLVPALLPLIPATAQEPEKEGDNKGAELTDTALTTPPPPPEQYVVDLPFDPPEDRIMGHPLESLIAQIRTGKIEEEREWVLPMLVQALDNPLQRARLTAYSTRCPDGGGPKTRWGSQVRVGICAADPRYWGPGSVIWVGDPVNEVLVVEDTGGAIKGPHRFDVCTGDDPVAARRIGRRGANYVVLQRVPPKRSWGARPGDWSPPVLESDPH